MRFISIDCETSGLNPETCQVLSIALVLEDTNAPEVPVEELPHIHLIIRRDYLQGEPYAINLNKDIIQIIKEGRDERLTHPDKVFKEIENFLYDNGFNPGKLKVAGKNFASFDKEFIKRMEGFDTFEFSFHHRVLDVGPLFLDFKNDEWVPGLDTCMERAGVTGTVQHCAYEDSKDVIRVIRAKQ